jgi:hypothetical protein
MALLNFPSNPQIGDTYTIGTNTWTWNGAAWIKTTSSTANLSTLTATVIYVSNLYVTSSTSATSTTTGALVVTGGVGIGGDLYVGGTFYVGGDAVLTTSSFAYSINEGTDIEISLSTSTEGLIFNNISTLQSVTTRGNSTTNIINLLNDTQSVSTDSGALVVSGGLGVGKRINCESLRLADAIFDSTTLSINMNSTYIIDSYSLDEYRAAKYLVQIDEGTGTSAQYQMNEILLIANNAGVIGLTEYGIVSTNGPMGDFTASITSSTVELKFTPTFATEKVISLLRTSISS